MVHVIKDNEKYLHEVGNLVTEISKNAITDHGYFSIAFSGGSAATKVCTAFGIEKYAQATDFSKWKMFLSDERYVDLEDPDSNYKAIKDGLISKQSGVLAENVFTLKKTGDLAKDAENYEQQMQSVFSGQDLPVFDLIILGMGPDGHICSLFPNHPLLKENTKWIGFLEDSPKPPPQRITFTIGVVNNAANILFIATGESKADNVKKAVEGNPSEDIPASLVNPSNGKLYWFLDAGSASKLA